MTKEPVILQELGILYDESNRDYEAYANVYDKKHAYYDESQVLGHKKDFEALKAEAIDYVENGVDGTYAVITDQGTMPVDEGTDISEIPLDGSQTYDVKNVLWNMVKINEDTIMENSIET